MVDGRHIVCIIKPCFYHKAYLAYIRRDAVPRIPDRPVLRKAVSLLLAKLYPGTVIIGCPVLPGIRVQVAVLCVGIRAGTGKHINFELLLQNLFLFFRQGIRHFPHTGADLTYPWRNLCACDRRDFPRRLICPMKRQCKVNNKPVHCAAFVLRLVDQVLDLGRPFCMDVCRRDHLLILIQDGSPLDACIHTGDAVRFPERKRCRPRRGIHIRIIPVPIMIYSVF